MSAKQSRAIIEENLPSELKSILENVLDKDLDDLKNDDDLTDPSIDSVMMLEIMVTLERTYGVKFQQTDLTRITSINDMMSLLVEKRDAQLETA